MVSTRTICRAVCSYLAPVMACILLLPATSAAQGTSAATITGVVRDASGAVLPGVTVEVASPALIEKVRSATSDAEGQFRVIELRPGTYSVTFTLPGFSTLRREGVELAPNFTATLNAELKVGGLQETVTVSGQTPLVDVQNVNQQTVISKSLLDAVPSNKSMLSLAALMPSVVTPASAQDVGGTKGETSVRISVHGGRPGDAKLLQDGMRYNSLVSTGTGRGFYANPLGTEEMVIDLGAGGSAETSTGGAQTNIIPRDGGNKFNAAVFGAWTNNNLQANNLTDDLKAKGLLNVNGTREIHDANAFVGGPLFKDRLWFASAHRQSGRTARVATLFHDSNLDDFAFTPDVNNPVEPQETLRSHNVRLTWQAPKANKVTFSYDWQRNWTQNLTGQLDRATLASEANFDFCQKDQLTQATWTHPHSSRLLFEGGATVNLFSYGNGNWGDDLYLSDFTTCGGEPYRVSIFDSARGFTYHGIGQRNKTFSSQANQRFTVSYLAGSHQWKAGMFALESIDHLNYTQRGTPDVNGLPVSYTFNNGVPSSLTQFASPLLTDERLRPELSFFIQDRWNYKRMTLSLGLRYEYVRAYTPAISEAAGLLIDARSFPAAGLRAVLARSHAPLRPGVRLVRQRADGRQVRREQVHRRRHRRLGVPVRPGQLVGQQHHPHVERHDLPGRRPPASELPARLRSAQSGRQRRMRRHGEPELRAVHAGHDRGSELDYRMGQAALQLALLGGSRARAHPRPRGDQRRLLPDDVRQLHRDRQPTGHAGRLRSVLRDGADRRAPPRRHQRPEDLRLLRPQARAVRPAAQRRHPRRRVRQAVGGL